MNHKTFNLILASALLIAPFPIYASYFNDEVDAKEAASAIIHCAEEAKMLLHGLEYLESISAKYEKVSEKISKKTYTFRTALGYPNTWGPPYQVKSTLTATLTITQPPAGRMDAGSSQSWSCSLEI